MPLPGFTAEASIDSAGGRYRSVHSAGAEPNGSMIVPQQFGCGPCLRPFGIPWLPGVMFCFGIALPC
jgi:hypothetical protein